MAPERPSQWLPIALVGAVAMAVGSVGPWATVLGLISVDGTAGDGKITLAAAAVAGLACLRMGPHGRRDLGAYVAVAAVLVGAVTAGYDLSNLSSAIGSAGAGGIAQVGWGLYAVLAGALVTLGAIVSTVRNPGPRTPPGTLPPSTRPPSAVPAQPSPFD